MSKQIRERARPVIVGVAGGSGSGKTTVVQRIVEKLHPLAVTCIQHDSYYFDRSDLPATTRARLNFDHPNALETQLLVEHLSELLTGNCVSIPVYDFATHQRTTATIPAKPHKVILVEGILVLVDEALRNLMDIKVFVDTDADLRLIRRLQRDITTRKRTVDSVANQYLRTVRPMHMEFVEPSRRYADVVIQEGGHNEVGIETLAQKIRSALDALEPETPVL